MSKPTIAVDIDEVLAKHYQGLAAWHNARYGTSHTEDSYFTDHWSQVWGVSNEETERRAHEFHAAGEHRRFEVVNGAQQALKALSQNYTLTAVTVRRQLIIPLTHQWLDEFFPNVFNDVKFVPFWETQQVATKADICREIGAEWLIDDNIKHCTLAGQQGITSLLFGDYAWNKAETLPEGVIRLKNWQEVRSYFDGRPKV